MADSFRLTLAQMNPTVGAFAANARKALSAWSEGKKAGADMVALPEMFLSGYQLQDLVMRPAFQSDCEAHLIELAKKVAEGPALGIGAPHAKGDRLHNSYAILRDGRIVARILKHHLPNDDVFDEMRVFDSGPITGPYRVGPLRIGSPICEDAWYGDVTETLAESAAEILFVPNGSPYDRDKHDIRMNLMVARVIETGLPLVYLNLVGGQDDQVFDGASFVLNPGGRLAVQLPMLDETVTHVDFENTIAGWRAVPARKAALPDIWERDYHVMVTALHDYVQKTGFKKVLLGFVGRG